LMDGHSQVRRAAVQAVRTATWLRDEEADGSLANGELQPLWVAVPAVSWAR